MRQITETRVKEGVIAATRVLCRGSITLKHADRFTHHIPDLQTCWVDRSAWTELKYLRRGRRLQDIVDIGQLVMLTELGRVHGGRGFVAIIRDDNERTEVWRPGALAKALFPKVAGPPDAIASARPYRFDDAQEALNGRNAFRLLAEYGMLWSGSTARDYYLVARVIRDSLTAGLPA